jgi:putative membrane protein
VHLLKLVVIVAIMILGASFAGLNPDPVEVDYYFGVTRAPLAWVVVLAVAGGAVLGALAGLGAMLRLRGENAELRRKARLTSEELNNLRSLPIKDQ